MKAASTLLTKLLLIQRSTCLHALKFNIVENGTLQYLTVHNIHYAEHTEIRSVSVVLAAMHEADLTWIYMSHLMKKPTKWHVHTAKTQISLGIRPVWSVFAVHMKKPWVLSYPVSAQRTLIRLGGCPGWSESSLGAQVILSVLSWGGSYGLCYVK